MFEDILGEKEKKQKTKKVSVGDNRNKKMLGILRDVKEEYNILKEKISVNDRKKFAEFCKTVWDNKEEFIKTIDKNIKIIEETIGR